MSVVEVRLISPEMKLKLYDGVQLIHTMSATFGFNDWTLINITISVNPGSPLIYLLQIDGVNGDTAYGETESAVSVTYE